jgi:hypothetical protein
MQRRRQRNEALFTDSAALILHIRLGRCPGEIKSQEVPPRSGKLVPLDLLTMGK